MPNPDPNKKAKVDFCTYWKATWDTAEFEIPVNRQYIDRTKNPNGLTARQHLAHQYPGRNFREEFVWLQEDINAPAKQNVRGRNFLFKLNKTNFPTDVE